MKIRVQSTFTPAAKALKYVPKLRRLPIKLVSPLKFIATYFNPLMPRSIRAGLRKGIGRLMTLFTHRIGA